jgi:hypothetical protein
LNEYACAFGETVCLVGSAPQLGCWDASNAVRMTWTPGHCWQAWLEVDAR